MMRLFARFNAGSRTEIVAVTIEAKSRRERYRRHPKFPKADRVFATRAEAEQAVRDWVQLVREIDRADEIDVLRGIYSTQPSRTA